ARLVDGRLGFGRALGLGLFGQIATASELDPQIVGRRRLQRAHGPHAFLAHGLQRDDQILAGNTQLFREVDDLDSCRHSPLTSSSGYFRPDRSELSPPPTPAARWAA